MKQTVRDKVVFLDTETTGLGDKDQVIELAHITIKESLSYKDFVAKHTDSVGREEILTNHYIEQFFPSVPIHPSASSINGWYLEDLIGRRPSYRIKLDEDIKYLVGHNVAFDHRMLKRPEGVKLICTKKLVMLLKRNNTLSSDLIENNQLDTLIEYFDKDNLIPKLRYHSALTDCTKVMLLLEKLAPLLPEIESWDDLYAIAGITNA